VSRQYFDQRRDEENERSAFLTVLKGMTTAQLSKWVAHPIRLRFVDPLFAMKKIREEYRRRVVVSFMRQHDVGPEAGWDETIKTLFVLTYPEAHQ
jgi:hypothetical protein